MAQLIDALTKLVTPAARPESPDRRAGRNHWLIICVILVVFVAVLAGCGAGAGLGATSSMAPYLLMVVWLFVFSTVGFLTGCGSGNSQPFPPTVAGTTGGGGTTGTVQGVPVEVAFVTQPDATALTKIPAFTVAVEDASGNVVTGATNAVTIGFGTNPSKAVLGGTTTQNAVNGVATFNDITISVAGANFTLVASSPGLSSATSLAFTVNSLPLGFQPGVRLDTPTGGVGVDVATFGDFNNDGKQDVATAGPNTVSVFLGVGDGTYQPAGTFSTFSLLGAMVTADFNGDGKADLAVGDYYSNQVTVYFGNGDGTFRFTNNYSMGTISGSTAWTRIAGMVVGDFDGQGKVDDIAVAGYYSSPSTTAVVNVLLGNGSGALTAPNHADYTFASHIPAAIASGDLRATSHQDLVIFSNYSNSSNTGEIEILLGNNDGTFTAGNTIPGFFRPQALILSDLNGDSKLDIVASHEYAPGIYLDEVSILLGNGDGTFQGAIDTQTADSAAALATSDLNGDGKPDLVCGNRNSGVTILLGNGDGSFGSPINYETGEDAEIASVRLADVNGDGKLDITTANGASSASFSTLLGNGDGTFQDTPSLPLPGGGVKILEGDVDGDGSLDFVTLLEDGRFFVVLHSNGTFVAPLVPPAVVADDFVLADVNGDGRLDIVSESYSSGTLSVLLGNGNGIFGSPTNLPLGFSPHEIRTADLNADGKPDLILTGENVNMVVTLLGNGDGTFGSQNNITVNKVGLDVAVADVNGDGKPDLVLTGPDRYSHAISVLFGHGDGTFGSAVNTTLAAEATSAVLGDFNGDGNIDIAVTNYSYSGPNIVSVLLGNNSGKFTVANNYFVGPSREIQTADINADGKLDLVVNAYSGCNLVVLIGNGDGSFALQNVAAGVVNDPRSFAIGDIDGDGTLDFVTANLEDDSLSIVKHK